MDPNSYQQTVDEIAPKRPVLKNCLKAFVTGGIICSVGQLISYVYMYFFSFTERTASNPTVATMVFISMLLTGFGIYKKIGQFGGAGSAVPVTGFGNAVISAAIEHKSEGFILGVGVNMFKLAGPVIVYGTFSAFVVTLIKTILVKMGVISW
ncbi:stage V sporulation protein AC [Paenisporosarcina quisquiliarum]|uniref:Stage V sporulation protein AC n=1 Tax=Paenisporosarcina quisquiliarum TaxID=365346 RepID=A0A9X3LEQ4_9BACL|nr:stage V sporulation protein AC [Paenisporosarcina quisquiliarum]MCZ8536548.1 stage V sporulation protein AC [Paenisporosarcina quisquiliarum]